MNTLIFLDTETTGLTEEDRMIQLSYKISTSGKVVNGLYNPKMPIGLESMSIHHITEKDIVACPLFKDSNEYKELEELINAGGIIVAHNAKFDIGMLEKEGLKVGKSICTKKVAIFDDKEGKLPNHRLQYLRYFYNVELDAIAHSAEGDVAVLEKVYEEYAKKYSVEKMLEISSKPSLILKFTFGKHNGRLITDVAKGDKSYLEWLYNEKRKENPLNEDWMYTLDRAIKSY